MSPLLLLLMKNAPAVYAFIRELWKTNHPGEPEPTDAEIIQAEAQFFLSEIAKDDLWLAAHPKKEVKHA